MPDDAAGSMMKEKPGGSHKDWRRSGIPVRSAGFG
jgi:hypothetical protein